MTMLLTETKLNDTATRKRRRMGDEQENTRKTMDRNDSTASIMINPATQLRPHIMVAPDFNCAAVFQHEISRLQLSDLFSTHKAAILFFYECDFTPISCKDLALINQHTERFKSLNAFPIALSTDTEMVHKAFIHQSLGFVPSFPLVSDTTRSVSRHFNVISPETGLAQRAAFVIDSKRQVRFSFVLEDSRLVHSMDTICSILYTF
ncbi:thioredoxin-like protein [Gilbertella persicaria]|uniref:Peroxiredoxin n=1 Tax=Rhizopus stolonifer TaxID=4846 RepID=A0A367KQK3_RHIST|nr:thioredoxin-like protein [Gilbertella persicaria]KAI8079057.1 thioredoxin-like protein [Gilbertella persicaria]RCI04495.1 peroxiredoxin [Rhizopus stolonifer]